MASIVNVKVTDRTVISALNTPGGAVHEWRDDTASKITNQARATSPVNNPLNAVHRGEVTGVFKASWSWDRRGSSGHHVVLRVENSADHAQYVEFGRSASTKMQIFSWTAWEGGIYRVGGPRERKQRVNPRTGKLSKLSKRSLAHNERIKGLPPRRGRGTSGRDGEHVLAHATERVLGEQGILVFVPKEG
jgi:hypothetical protein